MRPSGTKLGSLFAGVAALLAGICIAAASRHALPAAPPEVRIPITVYEDAGIARHSTVVRAAVPLPASAKVTDPASLVVLDEGGRAIPVQARALSRWDALREDARAPLRWVLLEFPADLQAHAASSYVATTSGAVRTAAPELAMRTASGAIDVSTAGATYRFTPDSPGPLRLVAGSAAPAQDASISLEENGPLSATIVARGELRDGFTEVGGHEPLRWTMRWRFTRDEPAARLQITIQNPDRPYTHPYNDKGADVGKKIGRLALEWVGDRATAGAIEIGGVEKRLPDGAHLVAPDERWRVTDASGARELARGQRAPGWIADGDRVLGMQEMWQRFPKGLSARGGTMALELFPVETFLQGSRETTAEVWIARGHDASAIAATMDAPPRAAVDPEWLQSTDALGTLSVADAARWPAYETSLREITGGSPGTTIDDEREAESAYGWLDFGDTFRAADPTHRRFGNNEFDFGWVLLRAYLRDPAHARGDLKAAHDSIAHLEDVDVMHTEDDAPWANHGVRKHDTVEVEHSHPPDFSHFWVRGLTSWYVTTGDERARDVALGDVRTWIRGREEPGRPGMLLWATELRDVGWVLVALDDLYQVDGDPEDLALAQRIVRAMVLPNVRESGSMADASFMVHDRGWFAPWQEAYIADGMGRIALSLRRRGSSDAAMEAALARMLRFLGSDEVWIRTPTTIYGRTYPETLAFELTGGKKDANEASMTQALIDPFVWGWLLTGDARFRDQAKRCAGLVFSGGPDTVYYDRSIHTPAKSAAIKLYFGDAERWREQTADGGGLAKQPPVPIQPP